MAAKLTAHLPWPGLLGPHFIRGPDFTSQLRWTGLPLLPLLPMLPPGFLSGLSYTVLSREEIGFGSRDGGAASIPYLVTGGSLAQSQHLLQGLGYDLLPLVQKLSFPITEVKAKAQVKVLRAASVRWGGVGWVLDDCSVEESLGQAESSQAQTHTPRDPSERSHGNRICPHYTSPLC